ncbi:MAG: cation-translocating P-type ATPase [Firmicutes bacterium]|nr:cation-translocating P-type ATPase [Bacillota bacterium]
MKVIHTVPGRLRLEVENISGRPDIAVHLEKNMLLQEGISKSEANPVTGRILIHYAPNLVSPARIQQTAHEILSLPLKTDPRDRPIKEKKTYELEKLPLGSQLGVTAAAGALLILTYFRREEGGKRNPDGTRRIDPNAALTALLGLPIFRTALDHLFQKKLSTELLGGVASATSLFIDKNRFGLSVLLVIYLNTLIRSAALEAVRDKIRILLEGKKPAARLAVGSKKVLIPGEQLAKGSLFEVRPGERLAADGVVQRGGGSLNQFPIQGRIPPRQVLPGDYVYAGSILVDGTLLIKASLVGSQTRIGRLIRHLKERKETPDKKAIRRLNQLSLLSLAVSGGYFFWTRNAQMALNMLVIGMPGAAGLAKAIPAEIGAVRAAALGALIKNGNDLAKLGRADLLLIEKGSFLAPANPESQAVITGLKKLGYQFPELTIPNLRQCTQEESDQIIAQIRAWQRQGKLVGIVGACPGDATVLSAVDIGITQASSDDLQLKSASIILTDKDPRTITIVALLARNSKLIAGQNSKISTASSALGYLLGFFNKLTPLWTGMIQNLSNLAILANSSRLLLPVSFQVNLNQVLHKPVKKNTPAELSRGI